MEKGDVILHRMWSGAMVPEKFRCLALTCRSDAIGKAIGNVIRGLTAKKPGSAACSTFIIE